MQEFTQPNYNKSLRLLGNTIFCNILPSSSFWALSLCPKVRFPQNFQNHFQILLVHPKDKKKKNKRPSSVPFSAEKAELPNFGEKPRGPNVLSQMVTYLQPHNQGQVRELCRLAVSIIQPPEHVSPIPHCHIVPGLFASHSTGGSCKGSTQTWWNSYKRCRAATEFRAPWLLNTHACGDETNFRFQRRVKHRSLHPEPHRLKITTHNNKGIPIWRIMANKAKPAVAPIRPIVGVEILDAPVIFPRKESRDRSVSWRRHASSF